MTFDPELPAGYQDADLEMAGLVEHANREAKRRRRGICTHSHLQGPPGPVNAPTTVCTCLQCGKVWPTVDHAHEDRREILI